MNQNPEKTEIEKLWNSPKLKSVREMNERLNELEQQRKERGKLFEATERIDSTDR